MDETSVADANEPTEPTAPKGPVMWHWGVGLVVLVLAIWAALLVHEKYDALFDSRRQEPRRRDLRLPTTRRALPATRRAPRRRGPPRGAGQGPPPASRPVAPDMVSAVTRAIGAIDLPELNRDPGRLAPPAEAVRQWARRRQTPGQVQEFGRYEFAGTPAAAASHYLALLLDSGYDCHNDLRPTGGPIRLEFRKDQTYASVSLRTDPRNAKIVVIGLVVLMTEE